jgi:hypothetical protein
MASGVGVMTERPHTVCAWCGICLACDKKHFTDDPGNPNTTGDTDEVIRWMVRRAVGDGLSCVQCGHGAVYHAVDDEERRECTLCDCKQYDKGKQ